MAEMLIQSESLTSIADKIRVLKGITDPMSLDDMDTQLDIPKNNSDDLTVSGATVTVPVGYYATQVTKSVATATQATPSVSIDSEGNITASATQAAGYVSAGTKTGTKQLTTQAAKTITPTKSSQTAVASGVYTTGVVTVGAIPNEYVTVQRITGTFTTNTRGEATVNCGFKPDLVVIIGGESNYEGAINYFSASAPFTEDTRDTTVNLSMWHPNLATYANIDIYVTQTNTGFTTSMQNVTWDNEYSSVSRKTYTYKAVKYT